MAKREDKFSFRAWVENVLDDNYLERMREKRVQKEQEKYESMKRERIRRKGKKK